MRLAWVLILFWLLIGAVAAGQRHYYHVVRGLRRSGHDRGDPAFRACQLLRRESQAHLSLASSGGSGEPVPRNWVSWG
jgi:hypothetical protein